MKPFPFIFLVSVLAAAIVIAGCSSSQNSSTKEEQTTPAPTNTSPPAVVKPEPIVTAKTDTLTVNVQKTQQPSYEQSAPSTASFDSIPTGRYSVQIGAYKMPDNAERIAALAKERFNMKVYSTLDTTDNLYKVMIGDFMTKDDARKFRDQMVSQFSSDYKDAWVSENPGR